MTLEDSQAKEQHDSSFNVNVGVREGDAMSVLLFNFVLDYFTNKLDIRGKSNKLVSINHCICG